MTFAMIGTRWMKVQPSGPDAPSAQSRAQAPPGGWRQRAKVISAMGAGGKLDPSKIKITDIANTKECKFAHVIRKRLKAEGIRKGIISVYSDEIQPKEALRLTDGKNYKRSFYGTISYMPALFGLTMASEVIRRIGELK